MLMVIFGAGASYDSVPTYLPPPTPTYPYGGDPANKHHRPPLANELFEDRPLFARIIQEFPACEPIIPRLRALNGETVEAALQELQEKAEGYPRGRLSMFGTVSLPNIQGSSNFYCPDLLLRNARRIQAFLQQQDFLIAFDVSELFLCFQQSGGGPAQRLISFAPTLYVARHPLDRG